MYTGSSLKDVCTGPLVIEVCGGASLIEMWKAFRNHHQASFMFTPVGDTLGTILFGPLKVTFNLYINHCYQQDFL